MITVNDQAINSTTQGINIPNTFNLMSMSADDRKCLGSMLQFYVDTGDPLRFVPNPAAFYTGALAVSTISAIGVATFTAIATPL